VLKSAFLVFSEKVPKLECTVRNISEAGAALLVSTSIGIPTFFDIVIERRRHHCRSVWRTDTKIGVAFQDNTTIARD